MLRTAARLLLLRVLPRRIVPIVTVVEALLVLRSARKRSRAGTRTATGSRAAPSVSQTMPPRTTKEPPEPS